MVGLVVAAWAMVALPARASDNARVTADEPQYLLSALALAEDLDLDISEEIRDRAYEPFHEVTIDPQTEPDEDGREFSPHDPLLPVVLAVPMALGGWVAAKATLAVLGGGAVLVGAGFAYPLVHQVVYGGWTVYAAGDHFQESGERGRPVRRRAQPDPTPGGSAGGPGVRPRRLGPGVPGRPRVVGLADGGGLSRR